MRLFGYSKETEKLRKLEHILEHRSKGIYKRIDTNRELLELIYKEAPDFINKCHWIEGWLKDQDDFLNELAETAQTPKSHYVSFYDESTFPRPYPSEPGVTDSVSQLKKTK